MLLDNKWRVLEPLVEQWRPKGKTPARELRCTLDAILWRYCNGAAWRAIRAEFAPWWRAAQLFLR
jgi:transposase